MFSLIVALDSKNGIGKSNSIPWSCPEDLKQFKRLTVNNVVIMGRKTFNSLSQPLPNRVNIIISRTLTKTDVAKFNESLDCHSPVLVFNDPMDCVKYCILNFTDKKLFVIGGSEIYNWFIGRDLIGDYHITKINSDYNCDTFLNINLDIADADEGKTLRNDAVYYYFKYTNKEENACLDLIRKIITLGNKKIDRTGVGTLSLFGERLEFDLTNNRFPLMTTRKLFLRGIFEELMLYIRGQTNSKILEAKGINVWTGHTSREFLDKYGLQHLPVGDMGPSYGFLFRHFGAPYGTCTDDYTGQGIDQLERLIKTIKTNPGDRRMIISLWDPMNVDKCPLPPCLYNYQFYVSDGLLSCMMTQRSSDFAVAGGWNIATGALLTIMLASVCGLSPGKLIWNLGDVHIYNNLMKQMLEQIQRTPVHYPKLYLKPVDNIINYEFSDLELIGYAPLPAIKLSMNV